MLGDQKAKKSNQSFQGSKGKSSNAQTQTQQTIMLQVLVHVIQQCHNHLMTHKPPIMVPSSSGHPVSLFVITSQLQSQISSLVSRPFSQKVKTNHIVTIIRNYTGGQASSSSSGSSSGATPGGGSASGGTGAGGGGGGSSGGVLAEVLLKEINLQLIASIVGLSSEILYQSTIATSIFDVSSSSSSLSSSSVQGEKTMTATGVGGGGATSVDGSSSAAAAAPASSAVPSASALFMSSATTNDLFDRYDQKILNDFEKSFFSVSRSHVQLRQQMENVTAYLQLMQLWTQMNMKLYSDVIAYIVAILTRYHGKLHLLSPNYYRIYRKLIQFLHGLLQSDKVDDKSRESVLKMLLMQSEDIKNGFFMVNEESGEVISSIQSLLETLVISKYRLRFYKVLRVIHEHESYARNVKTSSSEQQQLPQSSSASSSTTMMTGDEASRVTTKTNLLTDPFNDQNLQIVLGPLFHYIRIRRDRLRRMVTLTGHFARCPIFMYHLDGCQASAVVLGSVQSLISTDSDILFSINAYQPRVASVEWNTRVMQLVSMLSQQASPDAFSYLRSQNNNVKDSSKADLSRVYALNYTPKMLNEAIVYRILQLLNEKSTSIESDEMFNNVSQGNIAKWILLADQIYSLISSKDDFKQILIGDRSSGSRFDVSSTMNLRKAVEMYGDDIKDPFALWIILQIMPLYGPYCSPDVTEELLCLISELMHKKYTSWKQHELELLHYHHQFIMQRLANLKQITFSGRFMSRHIQQWRIESEKALDYYHLDNVSRKNLFLLSTYLSEPISKEIYQFLTTAPDQQSNPIDVEDDSAPVDATLIPQSGFVRTATNSTITKFTGQTKPLDIDVLLVLSTHIRKKVYYLLEESILSREYTQPLPPSIIETYVRIMYLTPSLYSKRLTSLSTPLNPTARFITMEVLCYRLTRFFKSNTEKLFKFLSEYLWIWTEANPKNPLLHHHRFFLTIENLFLRVVLYLVNDMNKLNTFIGLLVKKHNLKTHYTECVRRTMVFHITRILKLRSISAFTSYEITAQTVKILSEQCSDVFSDLIYAESRMQFTPQSLKGSLMSRKRDNKPKGRPSRPNEVTLQFVQQTIGATKWILDNLIAKSNSNQSLEDVITEGRKKVESPKESQAFLCSLWSLLYRPNIELKEPIATAVKVILNTVQTAFEYNCNIYRFVDFLLDEFIPQLEKNQDPNNPAVLIVSNKLSLFIWQYEFLPFDTLVQALIDRAGASTLSREPIDVQTESTYVIPILKHLFLTDTQFSNRVQYFIDLGMHVNHWEEPDYFTKHTRYHEKYPESWGIHFSPTPTPTQNLPSYYGNLCLRIIPVLDLLARRLIEVGENDFLSEFLDRYTPLLRYHDFPITFVKQMFGYYFDTIHDNIFTDAVRKRILRLAMTCGTHFSTELVTWIEHDPSDTSQSIDLKSLFSPAYFVQRIESAASLMPSTTQLSANDVSPSDHFKEFHTPYEHRINELFIEFMALPFTLPEKTALLLNAIIGHCGDQSSSFPNRIDAYRMTATTGVLLASMPQMAIGNAVTDYMKHYFANNSEIVLQDSIVMTGGSAPSSSVQSSWHVGEYLITNRDTALLTVLHLFFSNVAIDGMNSLRVILAECSTSLKHERLGTMKPDQVIVSLNLSHVYFLCRLIGPLLQMLQEQPFSKISKVGIPVELERHFLELFKIMCYMRYSTPVKHDLDTINPSTSSPSTLMDDQLASRRGVARKRTLEEMNETEPDLLTDQTCTIFQVMNPKLSHQSIPSLQNETQDEARAVMYEQIIDLLHHIHHLLYNHLSMNASNYRNIMQELKTFCTEPTVYRSLYSIIEDA